jgi:hypothetical protein
MWLALWWCAALHAFVSCARRAVCAYGDARDTRGRGAAPLTAASVGGRIREPCARAVCGGLLPPSAARRSAVRAPHAGCPPLRLLPTVLAGGGTVCMVVLYSTGGSTARQSCAFDTAGLVWPSASVTAVCAVCVCESCSSCVGLGGSGRVRASGRLWVCENVLCGRPWSKQDAGWLLYKLQTLCRVREPRSDPLSLPRTGRNRERPSSLDASSLVVVSLVPVRCVVYVEVPNLSEGSK